MQQKRANYGVSVPNCSSWDSMQSPTSSHVSALSWLHIVTSNLEGFFCVILLGHCIVETFFVCIIVPVLF